LEVGGSFVVVGGFVVLVGELWYWLVGFLD